MQGKSVLNPFATPYVPLSKLSSGSREEVTGKMIDPFVNNDSIDKSIEYQLPESFSLDYDIQSFQQLNLSGESSSKMGQHKYSDDPFPDEISEWDAPNVMLNSLSSMFPDISVEYLAELLAVNQGDFNETIDVLQQFECDGDGTDYSVETAMTSNNSRLGYEKASSSGLSDSI
ncbi:hypothetical protein Cni_G02877 [Canna indica]|uniref:CUE domain-containing protein n=1 Tax=Canna indica TaxID=4628 RepID=A0AAQ3JTH7_9LILI|nr:hypothetical protein Cni_G02877 [Canna indica]